MTQPLNLPLHNIHLSAPALIGSITVSAYAHRQPLIQLTFFLRYLSIRFTYFFCVTSPSVGLLLFTPRVYVCVLRISPISSLVNFIGGICEAGGAFDAIRMSNCHIVNKFRHKLGGFETDFFLTWWFNRLHGTLDESSFRNSLVMFHTIDYLNHGLCFAFWGMHEQK